MKYLISGILLIAWMLATLFLVCTIFGLIIICTVDEWVQIPNKLLKVFEN